VPYGSAASLLPSAMTVGSPDCHQLATPTACIEYSSSTASHISGLSEHCPVAISYSTCRARPDEHPATIGAVQVLSASSYSHSV